LCHRPYIEIGEEEGKGSCEMAKCRRDLDTQTEWDGAELRRHQERYVVVIREPNINTQNKQKLPIENP